MSIMGQNPPIKGRLRPTIYSIAVYLVGFFIVAQIIMLGAAFLFRQAKVKLETSAPAVPITVTAPSNKPTQTPQPKPDTNTRLTAQPLDEKTIQEIARLNEESQKFQQNGDYSAAETSLNQALKLDPQNPQTLMNAAQLQEALGNNEKALERWNGIIALGGTDKTSQLAQQRAKVLQDRISLEQQAKEKELQQLTLKRQIVIDSVKTDIQQLTDNSVKTTADFTIKRVDPNLRLEPGKMRIQLYFYNHLADGRVLPVTSKVQATFLDAKVNWTSTDSQVLR